MPEPETLVDVDSSADVTEDAPPSAAGPVPAAFDGGPTVLELEAIAAEGWRGTESVRMGGWLLRAGGGFTGRANSVLPLAPADRPFDDALAEVAGFYAARALPAVFQIPGGRADARDPADEGAEPALVDAALVGRGWVRYSPSLVLTIGLDELMVACPLDPTLPRATLATAPDAAWLNGYHYRGGALPAAAAQVLVAADEPVFVSLPAAVAEVGDRGAAWDSAGPPVAVARGAISRGWLGVTAVTVPTTARRRGLGRRLMGELARWAAPRAHSVYLQVDAHNEVALAMYRGLGFREHHGYHYLAAPVSSDS